MREKGLRPPTPCYFGTHALRAWVPKKTVVHLVHVWGPHSLQVSSTSSTFGVAGQKQGKKSSPERSLASLARDFSKGKLLWGTARKKVMF